MLRTGTCTLRAASQALGGRRAGDRAWSATTSAQTTISVLGSRQEPASPGVELSPLDNPVIQGDFPLVAAPNEISPDGVMGTVMRAEYSWIHFRFDAFGNQACSPTDLFCFPDDAFVAGNSTLPVAPKAPAEAIFPLEWWPPHLCHTKSVAPASAVSPRPST
jgi:hypothetical protein